MCHGTAKEKARKNGKEGSLGRRAGAERAPSGAAGCHGTTEEGKKERTEGTNKYMRKYI